MKTQVLTFLLSALLLVQAYAQNGMGLTRNPEKLRKVAAFPDPNQGAKSMVDTPLAYDLAAFAPPVPNQGSVPSCVAWSTAYNAFTVQYAAQNNLTDPQQLQAVALSAMLPFKQLRPSCDRGLDLPDIAQQMMAAGNLPHAEFSGEGCLMPPSADLLSRAAQNRPIMDYVRVFDEFSTNAEKLFRTRQQIGLYKTPVIVGIEVRENLSNLRSTDEFYVPSGKIVGLHAVTVVGYDTRGFKILNSWGSNWGKNGYFWVRNSDFEQIAFGGVALVLSNNYRPGPSPSPSNTRVGGEFAFQYLDGGRGEFVKLTPSHLSSGVYELSRKDWKLGERFQLLTNNPTAKQYMCVFSIDARNKLNVHWPRNEALAQFNSRLFGLGEADILPTTNFDVVIPSKTSAMTIEETGTDYLCVLYSDKPLLAELPAILGRIQSANGDIYRRIKAGLGRRLVPTSNIRYDANGMKGVANSTQGDTVPLVLKIQSN